MLALLMLCQVAAADYVLVVNASVPDHPMSSREVRRMISKQRCCWSNGGEAELILPPSSDASMGWFAQEFIGLDPIIFRRYLIERCYRLGCTPMISVEDLESAQSLAQHTPGAITLAHVDQIPDGLRELSIIP
jgi:hypothetical protein